MQSLSSELRRSRQSRQIHLGRPLRRRLYLSITYSSTSQHSHQTLGGKGIAGEDTCIKVSYIDLSRNLPFLAAANPAEPQPSTQILSRNLLSSAVQDRELTPPVRGQLQTLSTLTMVLYPTADEIRQRKQQQQAANLVGQNSAQSMAGQQRQGNQYLSPNQQDLLLAALNSQANGRQDPPPQAGSNEISNRSHSDSTADKQGTMNGVGVSGTFMSPTEADFDDFGADYTPDLDYLDGNNFDFENADLGGEMIGALPGSGGELNGDLSYSDLHEKRKNSEDSADDEVDAKRQDTQEGEKGAKKPGRKPLTSEPTTVRLSCSIHI